MHIYQQICLQTYLQIYLQMYLQICLQIYLKIYRKIHLHLQIYGVPVYGRVRYARRSELAIRYIYIYIYYMRFLICCLVQNALFVSDNVGCAKQQAFCFVAQQT